MYKTAIILLELAENELMKLNDFPEMIDVIEKACTNLKDPQWMNDRLKNMYLNSKLTKFI